MCLLVLALALGGAGAEPPHRYLPSRKVLYQHVIGDLEWAGTVNEAGEFVRDLEVPPRPKGLLKSGSNRSLTAERSEFEAVYEYRFKRLIPGNLRKGEFIPRVGGKVIAFQEYLRTYSKHGVRVYNLPGKIVTQEAYDHLKAEGRLKDEDK